MAVLHKTDEPLMTADELARRPDLEPCELVEGRIESMTPTGFVHGDVESELVTALRAWSKTSRRGKVVGGEVGLYLRRNPDTVRAADVLYISFERLDRRGPSGYLDVPPELVVEVLSPDDRWSEVMQKLEEYLAFGIDRVWIVDPRLRQVFAYRSLTEIATFGEGDELQDGEILPGFRIAVADLFR
jgi:Uma2 family endonuclease